MGILDKLGPPNWFSVKILLAIRCVIDHLKQTTRVL